MNKSAIRVSVAVSGVAVLLLAGCAGRAGSSDFVPAAASSAEPVICSALLDEATVQKLRDAKEVEGGAEYQKKVAAEQGSFLGEFVNTGGVACAWGDGYEAGLLYGYGPITAEAAAAKQTELVRLGSVVVEGSNYVRYTHPDGYPGGYAFGNGYWAYALDNGFGDVLDQIVSNAPRF
ncbi:hypothetical protein QT381_12140 [Galbitalea sp. SE-J8]|uniref:hypothetical protein n=1 Tax=Galbitalea sp. SE-J8 TaxID=3054952 RepID=UPI00259D0B60|nr:hypothetical protein [Galbitalea sp. SE-J8]MDM4763758.1 hypothetical protein [Galbitalea sp. SE-J8]